MKKDVDLMDIATMDDGRINEAFRQLVRRCASDCEDRPGVKKPRVVKFQLELTPVADENGGAVDVVAEVKLDDKAPVRRSKTYQFALLRGGVLAYNPSSLNDVHQRTLDEQFDMDDEND